MASNIDVKVLEFARKSRNSAIIGSVGLSIAIVSLGASTWLLWNAESQVAALKEKRNQLSREIDASQGKAQALEAKIQELENEVRRLNGPLENLVVAHVHPEALPLRDQHGWPLFDFTIWLAVPDFRKSEISEVEYSFKDRSALLPTRVGKDSSNGFAVNYRGWGCYPNMTITVFLKDGTKFDKQFDQCKALDSIPLRAHS